MDISDTLVISSDFTFTEPIIPSTTWDPTKPAVKITGSSFKLKGSLVVDERGHLRTGLNGVAQAVVFTNCRDIDCSELDITVISGGIEQNDPGLPSGPDVAFVAKDSAPDLYLGDIGECVRVTVRSITIVTNNCRRSFGVRFMSEFTTPKTNSTSHVSVGRIQVHGVRDWNAVEIAGATTHNIIIKDVHVKGKTGCGVDFDKNAYLSRVNNVTIENSGRSPEYEDSTAIVFSSVAFHGGAAGCMVGNLTVRSTYDNGAYASCCFIQDSTNCSLTNLTCIACGISGLHIAGSCDFEIKKLKYTGSRSAVQTDSVADTFSVNITSLICSVSGTAIAAACVGGFISISSIDVISNAQPSVPAVSVFGSQLFFGIGRLFLTSKGDGLVHNTDISGSLMTVVGAGRGRIAYDEADVGSTIFTFKNTDSFT